MSDELTQEVSNSVPNTEPTIVTLMERLTSMQAVMDSRQELADRRHAELRELIFGVRDDVNQRIETLQTATDANFRKQRHKLDALNDSLLSIHADQREIFQRVAVLEEKAS
ncbi:MAG: hypothetical protein AABO41_20140 [Acidobacteriota bacterium]